MHARAGVPLDNLRLAIVVHCKAVCDVAARHTNASAPLIEALSAKGVEFSVCDKARRITTSPPTTWCPALWRCL